MEETPKSRRGGKRIGAGRKPKGHVPPSQIGDIDLRAALVGEAPSAIETEAQSHARAALETFITVIKGGQSESAKISACNAILDRGYGKPSVDTGVDLLLPFMGVAPTRTVSSEIRDEARRFAVLAITVLKKIAEHGGSESARVSAAKSLLDRGLGTVGAAALADSKDKEARFGKKEIAERSASTAGVGTDWGDDLHIATASRPN